jgi:ribosomal protein S18 acetylase RimI-like enzyme
VRPGRPDDLPGLVNLWRADVRAGRRDSIPGHAYLSRVMAGVDWDARSRVVDGKDGRLEGAVLVSHRDTPLGTVAAVDAFAADGRPDVLHELILWGIGLSNAAGAVAAQVWRGRGHTGGLDRLGLTLVRPWWRMDRSLGTELPAPLAVAGYELRDATSAPPVRWAEVHNNAFADHWRFSPRSEEELMTARRAELSLLAVTERGSPAAITICQVENYDADPRPQPVGVVSSVGTLPDHRRRGLASWLVAEALARLRRAGARHASLYVDGLSPMRAFDAYRRLGFELAFETEVWEATFR